jgi:hypothetical protein
MVAQRVYALALGYEDLNDHEQLRQDPRLPAAPIDPGPRPLGILRRVAPGGGPSHPSGPTLPAWRHGRNVGALRANSTEVSGNRAYTFPLIPALRRYSVQLLSARVPVQTLTERGIKRERRGCDDGDVGSGVKSITTTTIRSLYESFGYLSSHAEVDPIGGSVCSVRHSLVSVC